MTLENIFQRAGLSQETRATDKLQGPPRSLPTKGPCSLYFWSSSFLAAASPSLLPDSPPLLLILLLVVVAFLCFQLKLGIIRV